MRLIFCTCRSEEAEGLARQLLEERLIGCANLVPGVRSLYWWKGEVCDDAEVVLFMETPASLASVACERLAELHSYDVPKIVVLDPEHVHPGYRAWLVEQASGGRTPR